uniref:PDZ domain-containing protein n=1 Tax=Macrostomum lignano TaxID=282301 RepID=A0A1I8JN06_9PLAT
LKSPVSENSSSNTSHKPSRDVNYHVYSTTQPQPPLSPPASAASSASPVSPGLNASDSAPSCSLPDPPWLASDQPPLPRRANGAKSCQSRDEVHNEIRQLTARCERAELALSSALEERDRLRAATAAFAVTSETRNAEMIIRIGKDFLANWFDNQLTLLCVDIRPIVDDCGFQAIRAVHPQPDSGSFAAVRFAGPPAAITALSASPRAVQPTPPPTRRILTIAFAPAIGFVESTASTLPVGRDERRFVGGFGRRSGLPLGDLLQVEAGFYVKQLLSASAAAASASIGPLSIGDRILAIDDRPLDGLSLVELAAAAEAPLESSDPACLLSIKLLSRLRFTSLGSSNSTAAAAAANKKQQQQKQKLQQNQMHCAIAAAELSLHIWPYRGSTPACLATASSRRTVGPHRRQFGSRVRAAADYIGSGSAGGQFVEFPSRRSSAGGSAPGRQPGSQHWIDRCSWLAIRTG